jgi:hypothetical protein
MSFDISFIVDYMNNNSNNFNVYPHAIINDSLQLENYIKTGFQLHKKNIIIYIYDEYEKYLFNNLPNDTIILHTSIVKKKKPTKYHYSFPYLFEPIPYRFDPIQKNTICPSISFCGHNYSHEERIADIKLFLNNKDGINTNFILLNKFWGGCPHKLDLINQFYDNMMESPFNLCSRGAGNFSMRFFQTLSCGRIPVLTNTDMEFPFEDIIDYKNFCIISDNRSDLINELLYAWNYKDIVQMQNDAYEVYQKFFTKKNYPEQLKNFLSKY